MTAIWHDMTMWNYLLTLIVCGYGAGLFGWWAKKAGNPSAVFIYVMSIFIAEGWAMGVAMQARYLHFYGVSGGYADYVANSWLWALRQMPTTLVLAALALHMSIRVFVKRQHRATDDTKSTYDEAIKRLVTTKASKLVAEAAIVAAEVVAIASSEAAKKVAKDAKKAAKLAQNNTDHIVSAINNIHQRRDDD